MSAHPQASAFLRAAYEGKIETVVQMLDDGVPVDACNQTGLQAIHFSAKTANIELADALLKRGANSNAATNKGNTPLHVAALMGHTELVKLLLRNGSDVNKLSECHADTFTPLYMASQIGHQEIVTLLLMHGADPTIATKNSSTPRDVARQQGFTVVAELLREYERKTRRKSRLAVELPIEKVESDESEESEKFDSAEASPVHKKLGPSPMCHDVTASPKNSPKRVPKRPQNLANGDQNLANGDKT